MLLAGEDEEEEDDEEEVAVSGSAWLADSTLQWDWAVCPALVWEVVSNPSLLGQGTVWGEGKQNYPKVQHFSVLPALCRASPWQVSVTFLKSLPGIMSVGNPLSWWGKAHTPFACGLHGGIPIYQAGLLPGMLHSVPPPTLLLCFM